MAQSSQLRFDNRVCIVTGAGQGIGREYSIFLASRGAKVLVNDLGRTKSGEKTADLVVAEIKKNGGVAVANHDSVDEGDKIVKQCMDAFGKIDVIINNAGILRDVSFAKMKESDWDLVHKVHLKGAFAVTRAAWPHFRAQGYGRIVNTSSPAGVYGNFGQVNYSAAKLGLHGFTRALYKEGDAKNIKVNTICPLAATAMTETVMSKEVLSALDAKAIVPLVGYLVHESCEANGKLYELGAGWVAELRWQSSEGHMFDLPFTAEDVAKNFSKIGDFSKPEYRETSNDSLPKMIQNYERCGGKLQGTGTSAEKLKSEMIFDMLKVYLSQGLGTDAVKKCNATYNFNITSKKGGPIKGKWAIDLKSGNGAVFTKQFDNADATFTLDDEEFYNECMRKSNPQMAFLKVIFCFIKKNREE